jgi:hypothetical protein
MPKFDYAVDFNRIREIDWLVIPAEKINCGRSRFQAPFTAARGPGGVSRRIVNHSGWPWKMPQGTSANRKTRH